MRHPDGRLFDGAWAKGYPLHGAAMDPDGVFYLAKYDGKTYLTIENWDKAERVRKGRIVSGGPTAPGDGRGGPAAAEEMTVVLEDGTKITGPFSALRPVGRATLVERDGRTYDVEYDGLRTIAEGPAPVRKEVPRAARARNRCNRRLRFF
jgi:hypothetical protein